MRTAEPSPLDTLEACFRLLTTGPAPPLALDGRLVGHRAPARSVPLGELRVLLQHPAATDDLQRAILQELIRRAVQHRGSWMVGLAGVLLPGFRDLVGTAAPMQVRAATHVEADMLEWFCQVIDQPACRVVEFAITLLDSARRDSSECCRAPAAVVGDHLPTRHSLRAACGHRL